MSEQKKTEVKKVGLADMLSEAGIDASAIRVGKKGGFRAGCAFGIKEPISDVLLALAKRNVTNAYAVADKKFRSKLSKKQQDEWKAKKVVVVDHRLARRACMEEIERMQNNISGKGPISREIAADYGVYRTNEAGEFMVVQKIKQARQPQFEGIVKRLARKLEAEGVDFYDAGEDSPVLIIDASA